MTNSRAKGVKCFNVRCILPAHLEAVPPLVNRRRGRDVILSLELVRQIRAEYAALPRGNRAVRPGRPLKTNRPVRVLRGARAALREKYGLSHEHFRDIVTGRLWPDG